MSIQIIDTKGRRFYCIGRSIKNVEHWHARIHLMPWR
jgi:hypothetical protein